MFQSPLNDKSETLDFSIRYTADNTPSSAPAELKQSFIPEQQAMLILPNALLAVGSKNTIQLIDSKLHHINTLDHKNIAIQSTPYLRIKISASFDISIQNPTHHSTHSSFASQNVTALCVLPDGTLISCMDNCKQVFFWDTKTHQCILVVETQLDNENFKTIHAMTAVANHCLAIALTHKIILVWNMQQNNAFLLENDNPDSQNMIYTLVPADNNQLISIASSGTIWIWNIETKKISNVKLPDCNYFYAWPIQIKGIVHLAYFPKSKGPITDLSVFDPANGMQVKTYTEKIPRYNSGIAMLPSGEIIGMSRHGGIIVFRENSSESKRIVPALPGSSYMFWNLIALPDGRLAYGGNKGVYLSRSNVRTLNYSEIEVELKSFQNPRAIKKINLKNTYVDDNDIPNLIAQLERYVELLYIDLRNTNVTLKGIAKLREHFRSRNGFIVRHQQDDPLHQAAMACYESSLRLQNFLSQLNKDVAMQTQNTNLNAAASLADLQAPAAPDAKSPIPAPVAAADNNLSSTADVKSSAAPPVRTRPQSVTAPVAVAAAAPRPQHQHAASTGSLRVIAEDDKRPSSPLSSGDEASSPPRAASPLLGQPLSPRDRRVSLDVSNAMHQTDAVQYFQGDNELKRDFKTPDSSYNFKLIDYLAWLNNKRASANKRSAWIYPIPHDASRVIGSAVVNTLKIHKTRLTAGIRRDQKEEINDLFLFIIEIRLTEATSHFFVGVIIEETLLIINPTDGNQVALQQTTLEIVSFLKNYNPIKNTYVVNAKPNTPDNPGTDSSGTFGIELLLNLANNINKKDFIGIFKNFPKLKANPKIVRTVPSNSQLTEISFVPGDIDHINLLLSSLLKELYSTPHKRAYIERLTQIKQSHFELLTQNGKSDLAVAAEQELAPGRNVSKHPCAVILTKAYELKNLNDTANKYAINLKYEANLEKKKHIETEKKAIESKIPGCRSELQTLIEKVKRKDLISWRGKEYPNPLMHLPLVIHLLEHPEALRLLLKLKNTSSKPFDVNLYDNDEKKNTALHIAASATKLLPSLNALLEQENIDLSRRNKAGNTPLHSAIIANCFDGFVALLAHENQLHFNKVNEAGETIIYLLIKNKRFEWVKKLLINPGNSQPYNTIPGKQDWIAAFHIKGDPEKGIHSALEPMKVYELKEKVKYDEMQLRVSSVMLEYKDIISKKNFVNFGEYDKIYNAFTRQYQTFDAIEKEFDAIYDQYFLHVYIHAVIDSDYYPEKDKIEILHQCRKILFCCFVFKFINGCHKKLDVNPKDIKSIPGTQIPIVTQQLADQKNLLSRYESEITKLWASVSQKADKIDGSIFDEVKKAHEDFLKNKSPSEQDDLSLPLPQLPDSLELKEIVEWKLSYDDCLADVVLFQNNSSIKIKTHASEIKNKLASITERQRAEDIKQEQHDKESAQNDAEGEKLVEDLKEPQEPENYKKTFNDPPYKAKMNPVERKLYDQLKAKAAENNRKQREKDKQYLIDLEEYKQKQQQLSNRRDETHKIADQLDDLQKAITLAKAKITDDIKALEEEKTSFEAECQREQFEFQSRWSELLEEKVEQAMQGYLSVVIDHKTTVERNMELLNQMRMRIAKLHEQASGFLLLKNYSQLTIVAKQLDDLDQVSAREETRLEEFKNHLTRLRHPLETMILMIIIIRYMPFYSNSACSLICEYASSTQDAKAINSIQSGATQVVSAPALSFHGIFGHLQSRPESSASPRGMRTSISFAFGNTNAGFSRARGSTHHIPMLPAGSVADGADHKHNGANANANASAGAAAAPGAGKSP